VRINWQIGSGSTVLSTSEMIFGMVGLLILLLGSVGFFGLRMLGKMRRRAADPSPGGDDPVTSGRPSNEA